MGLEVLRQIHYVIEEHNSAYYQFWRRVFGRWNNRVAGVNPWTCFRLGRLVNFSLILVVLTEFVAWRSETPFFETLVNLPSTVIDYMSDLIGELPFDLP